MSEVEMFRAVKAGDVEKVKALLAANPGLVHARDREQSTPLHHAAWKGHAPLVDVLVDAGADLQAHNENYHWGTTPLHAAAHGNQAKAAEALIRRGADVNALKASGEGRPLGETKAHNATAAAKVLKQAGAIE
ncbi:MAG TPA: ankyrin repeat domain-containing protein [Fimbriimonas sp.]|nr:ankyrin repeat domain-containing protein [Fimbriimonas sp.]